MLCVEIRMRLASHSRVGLRKAERFPFVMLFANFAPGAVDICYWHQFLFIPDIVPIPVSWAKPTPPRIPVKPQTSPNEPALNLSYSQIVKTSFTPRACDPGKPHMTTRDHKTLSISRVITRDPGKVSGDLPRDWSPTRSLGRVNFKRATRLLIHPWQMVGTINERVGNQQSHKTPNNWGSAPMRSRHPNRRPPIEDSPTVASAARAISIT